MGIMVSLDDGHMKDFTTNDTSVLASATLTSNAAGRNKDPHLLLYAFLPVLLFGDAMSIVPRQLSTVPWLFLQKNQQKQHIDDEPLACFVKFQR